MTDTLFEHLAFVLGSVEVDGRSSNDYSYNVDTRTLIADKIAIGKTLTYTFRITVEDGAQGQYIVNTAKVTSPGGRTSRFLIPAWTLTAARPRHLLPRQSARL